MNEPLFWFTFVVSIVLVLGGVGWWLYSLGDSKAGRKDHLKTTGALTTLAPYIQEDLLVLAIYSEQHGFDYIILPPEYTALAGGTFMGLTMHSIYHPYAEFYGDPLGRYSLKEKPKNTPDSFTAADGTTLQVVEEQLNSSAVNESIATGVRFGDTQIPEPAPSVPGFTTLYFNQDRVKSLWDALVAPAPTPNQTTTPYPHPVKPIPQNTKAGADSYFGEHLFGVDPMPREGKK